MNIFTWVDFFRWTFILSFLHRKSRAMTRQGDGQSTRQRGGSKTSFLGGCPSRNASVHARKWHHLSFWRFSRVLSHFSCQDWTFPLKWTKGHLGGRKGQMGLQTPETAQMLAKTRKKTNKTTTGLITAIDLKLGQKLTTKQGKKAKGQMVPFSRGHRCSSPLLFHPPMASSDLGAPSS